MLHCSSFMDLAWRWWWSKSISMALTRRWSQGPLLFAVDSRTARYCCCFSIVPYLVMPASICLLSSNHLRHHLLLLVKIRRYPPFPGLFATQTTSYLPSIPYICVLFSSGTRSPTAADSQCAKALGPGPFETWS